MNLTTPQYTLVTNTCLTNDLRTDMPIQGFCRQVELDTVIPQGFLGVQTLETALRKCMGNEPGTILYLGVSYTILKLELIQEAISSPRRVYLPGCMSLTVEPNKDCQFLRVRVIRMLVSPSSSEERREAEESDDEIKVCKKKASYNQLSETFPFGAQRRTTLRQRIL